MTESGPVELVSDQLARPNHFCASWLMELRRSWIVGLIEALEKAHPKRLVEAASLAFSNRSNILTIRDTTVEDLSEQLLLLSMKTQGVDRVPFVWFWPRGARSCIVMTHDVEAESGQSYCTGLMDIDDSCL